MTHFINNKLSMRSKIRLYRFLYTLNAMDFSYLRPVILASLLIGVLYIRSLLPESYLLTVSTAQVYLYYTVVAFLGVALLFYLRPYFRRYLAKFRVKMYRRKKKACSTFFL